MSRLSPPYREAQGACTGLLSVMYLAYDFIRNQPRMQLNGVQPNVITLNSLLDACAKRGRLGPADWPSVATTLHQILCKLTGRVCEDSLAMPKFCCVAIFCQDSPSQTGPKGHDPARNAVLHCRGMVVLLHGGLKLGTQPGELLRLAQRVRKSAKSKEGAGRDCDGNRLDAKAHGNLEQAQCLCVCE